MFSEEFLPTNSSIQTNTKPIPNNLSKITEYLCKIVDPYCKLLKVCNCFCMRLLQNDGTGDFNSTSFVLFATKPYFSIVRKFLKFVKRMKESLLVDCEYACKFIFCRI